MTVSEWISWTAIMVSFVAALFTALQWASVYRSAQSSERSAGAAERSATAAEESANSTKALAQLGQRPWMILEPPEVSVVESGDQVGYAMAVRAALRNSGLTPAFEVRAISQFGQWALPVTQWPLVQEPTSASTILGPNIPFNSSPTPILVTNEHLQEVGERRRVLLFSGDCLYNDVFCGTHRTRWCLRYDFGTHTLHSFNSEFNVMT